MKFSCVHLESKMAGLLVCLILLMFPGLPVGKFETRCSCSMHDKWAAGKGPVRLKGIKNIPKQALDVFNSLSVTRIQRIRERKFCDLCIETAASLTSDQTRVLGLHQISKKRKNTEDNAAINPKKPCIEEDRLSETELTEDCNSSGVLNLFDDEDAEMTVKMDEKSLLQKVMDKGINFALKIISMFKNLLNHKNREIELKDNEITLLKRENASLKNEIHNLLNTSHHSFTLDTEENRVETAKQLGIIENMNLLNSSLSTPDFSFEYLKNINPRNIIENQNKVMSTFIQYLTENKQFPQNDNVKLLKNAVIGECIAGSRNNKYVSPLCALAASVNYGTTGSKVSISTMNQLIPSGSYDHLTSWLFELHAHENYSQQNSDSKTSSLFYAFDNNQRLLRSWLSRNFNKQVVQIMTNVVKVSVNDDNLLQFDRKYHPSHWRLFQNLSEANADFPFDVDKEVVRNSYIDFMNEYVSEILPHLTINGSVDTIDKKIKENLASVDTIKCPICGKLWKKRKVKCDMCKINMRAFEKSNLNESNQEKPNLTENSQNLKFHLYEPSKTLKIKQQLLKKLRRIAFRKKMCVLRELDSVDIGLISPIFVNPGSKESIKLVLNHIGKDAGISTYGTGDRQWCFIVCDGSPMTLLWQIIFEDPEMYGWVIPVTGLGHEEMNMTKGVVELLWEVIYKEFLKSQGYVSPKTLQFMKSCVNHHLSFDNLDKFREALWLELLRPFVKQSENEKSPIHYDNFINWIESQNDKFLSFFVNTVMPYIDAVFMFRQGVRFNNSNLIQTARAVFSEVWFARRHTKYQIIILFEQIQRMLLPPAINNFLKAHESFSKSCRRDAHQGLDFLLEEYNKSVKNWISGAASFDKWEKVIINVDHLSELKSVFQSFSNLNNNSGPKLLPPFQEERDAFRVIIRSRNFLFGNNNKILSSDKSSSSMQLSQSFYDIGISSIERRKNLTETIKKIGYPHHRKYESVKKIPLTENESAYLNSDEKKTKNEIRNEIESLLSNSIILESERSSFQLQYSKIKNGTKELLLLLLHSIRVEYASFEAETMEEEVP